MVEGEETSVKVVVETTLVAAAAGGVKVRGDTTNYVAKSLKEFETIDASTHPDPASEIKFVKSGVGKNSINIFWGS